MNTSTLITRAFLTFALLALAATAVHAQTRIFQVKVTNNFDREISIEAKAGNGNYQGQQKKMAIAKGGSEFITLAFNNRSSIGFFDGHVNLAFNDNNTLGEGRFDIRFDRGGRIYRVDLIRPAGETSISDRPPENWFTQETTYKKDVGNINVMFSGPKKWTKAEALGFAGSSHYYTLVLSSLLTPVLENVSLIVDYQDGPRKVTVFESMKRQQEQTYQRVMENSWSVSSTVGGSYAGVSGSATGGAAGSQQTTAGNKIGDERLDSKEVVVDLQEGQMRFTVVRGDILKNEVTGDYRFRLEGIYNSSIITKRKEGLKDFKGYYSVDPSVMATGLKLKQGPGQFMEVVGD